MLDENILIDGVFFLDLTGLDDGYEQKCAAS
jgi:hypothetical protein